MSKEYLEDLIIEFDELGFEPTILCDQQKEIESFRNRLKQVLDYLKSLDNANPSEALECLERFFNSRKIYEPNNTFVFDCITCLNSIKQALLKAQEQEKILDILKRIIKVKKSDVYEFVLVVRGTDEEEDTIKEWLENA